MDTKRTWGSHGQRENEDEFMVHLLRTNSPLSMWRKNRVEMWSGNVEYFQKLVDVELQLRIMVSSRSESPLGCPINVITLSAIFAEIIYSLLIVVIADNSDDENETCGNSSSSLL
jgi:hypothetical protein